MIEGYNIALKLDSKTILGRTQDDLSISSTTKTSLTKDDGGDSKEKVIGHEVTFACNGLIDFNPSSGVTSKLDRDDIMALALAKGTAAEVSVQYVCPGGDTYEGKAIVQSYSESSNSEDYATYTVNFKISGSFTKTSS